mmetsp:Transcript_21250/g.18857  ORF Transcript_21250/g.18857 Transcript_21250/m.18857 type:complete len:87 (+) Transcript_21250:311-571(+)
MRSNSRMGGSGKLPEFKARYVKKTLTLLKLAFAKRLGASTEMIKRVTSKNEELEKSLKEIPKPKLLNIRRHNSVVFHKNQEAKTNL